MSDLPTRELRDLGLPTIAWPAASQQLTPSERRMLLRLGVCERPPLDALLLKASDKGGAPTEAQRLKALKFVCDHMLDFYAEEYDERTEFKIIPLIEDEGSSHQVYGLYTSQKRARPCDCFVEASPWPSAFPVADRSAIGADGCVALRLPQRPQLAALLKRLSSHPPTDEKSAERVFEYMQQRAEELNDEHWASLSRRLSFRCVAAREESGRDAARAASDPLLRERCNTQEVRCDPRLLHPHAKQSRRYLPRSLRSIRGAVTTRPCVMRLAQLYAGDRGAERQPYTVSNAAA